MKTTAYVTHPDCSLHDTGWRHPDHQGRLAGIARAVYRDMLTLFDRLLEIEPVPAEEDDLRLAHAPEYIARVRSAVGEAADAGETRVMTGEVRLSGASWDAARAAAGAVISAVDAVLEGRVENAFCAVRPPGQGAGVRGTRGFSVFNNVAVGALHLRERRRLDRVLIVEWGAEAGRGTAEIVALDPGVRFVTVHQRKAPDGWPRGTTAAALDAGTHGAELMVELEARVEEATSDFAPDFILVSSGFDALQGDPVGDLALRPDDVYELTVRLRGAAERACGGRLVSVLEGGYDAPATGLAVVQHLRALAGLPRA